MKVKQKPRDLQQELLRQLTERYRSALRAVFLVGSQARGNAKPFSDINLLVLTEDTCEQISLFPRGELAQVTVKPLALFLAELYAPAGRQVLDWWLMAGDVQQAVPWHDPGGVLPIARRMIDTRLPLVELYGRILWEDELARLNHYQEQLCAARPFEHAYQAAAARFARQAEAVLRIYHGQILPRCLISLLPRPKSFSKDWASIWCLGAEPAQVDLGAAADAIGQIVRGIWLAGYQALAQSLPPQELTARQQALDRAPGSKQFHPRLPAGFAVSVPLMDECLRALWVTVKCLLQRQPVELLAEVQQLSDTLDRAGLLGNNAELDHLLHIARVPQAANPERVAAATERIRQALLQIEQTPLILPQTKLSL